MSFARNMKPGDTRTSIADDRVVVIHRTTREYVYDMCDAYNAAMSEAARARGLQWFVDGMGHMRLGETLESSRMHARRQQQREDTID